jgi:Ca2+-binding RTX toxin-like protein
MLVNLSLFSASAFNHVGVQYFEWDFDGDGQPDSYTVANPPGAQNATSSIVFSFSSAIAAFPRARAIDNDGFVSDWDEYDVGGQPVQMVVGSTSAPSATLNQWAPYSATGPDGIPSTTFTFSASAVSSAGIARLEWDFDGDSNSDLMTPLSGSPTSVNGVTAMHRYNTTGTWVPQVRAVDTNNLSSSWAAFMVNGSSAVLDTSAPAMNPVLNFSPRAASDLGPDGNTATVFTFTATYSSNPVSFRWDFDGDGVMDVTTTAPTSTHVYPVAGSYLPSVTVVDTWGTTEMAFPHNSSGQEEKVDVSPLAPTATMNAWSPYSANGPDGNKNTIFTFSANATALGGLERLEWDFNGDGVVDTKTSIPGAPTTENSTTTTFSYLVDGNYTPQVRAVDKSGQVSEWDAYNVSTTIPLLDVTTPAPSATMDAWSPFEPTGPDGYTTITTFTMTAEATSVVGIDRLEWDFDGDGNVDAATELNGELSVSAATKTHIYSSAGSYIPAVRAVDIDGRISNWDSYNDTSTTMPSLDAINPPPDSSPVANAGPDQIVVIGSTVILDGTGSSDADAGDTLTYFWSQNSGPISVAFDTTNPAKPTFSASSAGSYVFELQVKDQLGTQSLPDTAAVTVVDAPTASMNHWTPYSANGPDGSPTTVFTFSANATAAGGIARLEWDFDGDGNTDATTAISGAPTSVNGITTTFTYGSSGTYTPKVRVVDAGDNFSTWDAYNVGATLIQLDISASAGDLYCGGLTIDQLIASHKFNVIDNRDGHRKTLNGSDGNDLILASRYGDVINAKKGDDCIIGGAGPDIIHGHQGNDQIYGNGGNDLIFGDNGDDKLYGGDGDDVLYGGNGNDTIGGDSGDDDISGGNGNNTIDGGDGNDGCNDNRSQNSIHNIERSYRNDHRDDDN